MMMNLTKALSLPSAAKNSLSTSAMAASMLVFSEQQLKAMESTTEKQASLVLRRSWQSSYDAEYIDGHDDADARIWGAGLTLNVVDDFRVYGDFYRTPSMMEIRKPGPQALAMAPLI